MEKESKPDFDEFSERIDIGYYDGANGTAQFKDEILDCYGEEHEEKFRELWNLHDDLEPRDRLVEVLDEFVKQVV